MQRMYWPTLQREQSLRQVVPSLKGTSAVKCLRKNVRKFYGFERQEIHIAASIGVLSGTFNDLCGKTTTALPIYASVRA
jgi:hypothetical protein